jgi:hypothetical protein
MAERVTARADLGVVQYEKKVATEWRPVIGAAAMDVYQFYCLLYTMRHDMPPLNEKTVCEFLQIHHYLLADSRLILRWCGLLKPEQHGSTVRWVILSVPTLTDEYARRIAERVQRERGAIKRPYHAANFLKRLANRRGFADMVRGAVPKRTLFDTLKTMGISGPNIAKFADDNRNTLELIWSYWWMATPDKKKPAAYLAHALTKRYPPHPGYLALAQWWLAATNDERMALDDACVRGTQMPIDFDNEMSEAAREIWEKRGTFDRDAVRSAAVDDEPKQKRGLI